MSAWLINLIEQAGYIGVALLMLAETLFPPIPSEVIMPLAGLKAAQDGLSLAGVIFAGTLGATLGNIFWYVVARWLGYVRFERLTVKWGPILTFDREDLQKARSWFDRFGPAAVGIGRIIPGIRSLISVPAGILEMPFLSFTLYSTLGATLWTAFLALVGYGLGASGDLVTGWVMKASDAIIGFIAISYLYRLVMYQVRRRAN